MTPALATEGLSKSFGALRVARDIDFALAPGARHALIGPNGAGKTSFINLVTGRLAPSAGRILLAGDDVTAQSEERRVKRGLVRTFQVNALFRELTTIENVALAVAERNGSPGRLLGAGRARRRDLDESHALLARLRLADEALRPVRALPYGKQRLVEIAIALALEPTVLLLDEPAAGLPSGETGLLLDLLETLPPDVAVLIVEHDMDLVFRLASRITVLVQGAVLIEGTPAEVAAEPRVRAVYLGEGHAA
jgi:branched-chain amino acid transport system ATP-binding protein